MKFSLLASFSKGSKFRDVFLLTSFSKEVSREVFFAYFLFQKKVGQLLALFMVRRISTPLSARQ